MSLSPVIGVYALRFIGRCNGRYVESKVWVSDDGLFASHPDSARLWELREDDCGSWTFVEFGAVCSGILAKPYF